MTLLQPKTKDAGNEKHLPVVTKLENNQILVEVGSIPHPMAEDHWIQWVFVEQGDQYQIKTFNPGEEPKATFTVKADLPVKVYEFCNLHGLWMTEL